MRRFPPALLSVVLAACGAPDDDSVDDTEAPDDSPYADDALWACLPGSPDDVCAYDLTATELHPDGSRTTVTPARADDPAFDCFYVYPTVKLTGGGLDTDFSEPGARLDPLLSQAAPLTRHCAVYAPYYRQAALDAFGTPGMLDTAYDDVREAFRQFLDHRSHGRPFAIVGHSQGTMHLTKLLAEEIEPDAALRDRLVVAVLLGGTIVVPDGADVGGTFASTPLCTERGQRGCVLSWVTYAEQATATDGGNFGHAPAGSRHACTDPLALAGHGPEVAGSWWPTRTYGPAFDNLSDPYADVETPFVLTRDSFEARCVSEGDATWLQVSYTPPEGDVRPEPPWRNTLHEAIGFGMHAYDFNLPIEDLLDVIGAIEVP